VACGEHFAREGWSQSLTRTQHRTRGSQAYGRGPVLRVFVGTCVVLGIVIVAAVLFAPEKPSAPPASEISYEQVPARPEPRRDVRPLRGGGEVRTASTTPTPTEEAPPAKFMIGGTVTDQETGEPIQGVRVSCRRRVSEAENAEWQEARANGASTEVLDEMAHGQTQRQSAVTDKEGRYRLPVTLSGTYEMNLYHHGYVPVQDELAAFEEGQSKLRVDFVLSRGATVSGRVTESGSHRGAAGIKVHSQTAMQLPVETDRDGRYTISGLTADDHVIMLDLHDAPYLLTGGIPSRNVSVTSPTDRITGIDFVVEPAGTVWGYVFSGEREPVASTDVIICGTESVIAQAIDAVTKQAPPIHARSDGDGYYALVGVPLNEEWRVYAASGDWAPQLSDPFILSDSQRAVRVDLFLLSGSDVYGRVVSTDGSPIPQASTVCIPALTKFFKPLDMPPAFRDLNSAADGTFVIRDLPPGDYQVLAQKEGFKFMVRGEPIHPDGYNDIHGVEVRLIPIETGEYSVFGMVVDEANRPIAGASVTLGGASAVGMTAEGRDTKTDARGDYVFLGVDPGFYVLAVEAKGYAPKTTSDIRLDEPTDIMLTSASLVRGRVLVRETNAPPPSYSVRALPESLQGSGGLFGQLQGIERRRFADPEGKFELGLPAGAYTLEAYAPALTPGRVSITVEAGRTTDNVVLYVSRRGASVAGRVRTVDGGSPAGAVVQMGRGGDSASLLVNAALDMEQRGIQVGGDGRFEFTGLSAGEYTLTAKAKGYAQGRSDSVTLREGQSRSGVEILLGTGGILQGYVTMDGALQAGAFVTVVGNGVSEMATSDRNGFYQIEGITAGSYLASAVSLEGGGIAGLLAPLHARVELHEGQTTTHNFGEESGASVTGYVNPAPPMGTIGYAVVRMPGPGGGMAGLNLTNPASWFTSDTTTGNYVMGMAQIDRNGQFHIGNVPEGEFILEVFYLNLGDVFSGGGQAAHQSLVTVTGAQDIEVDVNIGV
jgi:protocatechuate 3,4-dioxygenase beta subunit